VLTIVNKKSKLKKYSKRKNNRSKSAAAVARLSEIENRKQKRESED